MEKKENICMEAFKKGVDYFQGNSVRKNFHQSFFWFLNAAELDHPHAAFNAGFMFELGLGTAKDYDKALFWYKKAATHKMPIAYYRMSLMFLAGLGVNKNVDAGQRYLEQAIENGYTGHENHVILDSIQMAC